MIGWLLILVSGLLGSGHCVGMCGGFALALGSSSPRAGVALVRQLIYGAGRVFTYTAGGAAAGFLGWRFSQETTGLMNLQAILSIVAGVVLVLQGLHSAGWLRFRLSATQACPGPSLFGSLLQATRPHSLFLAGVMNGLLPCGLVYAFLALAASSGDLLSGALTMMLFGLGTVPILALVGVGGNWLSILARRRLLHLAAWCVVLTGLITLARGFGFLSVLGPGETAVCPFCG